VYTIIGAHINGAACRLATTIIVYVFASVNHTLMISLQFFTVEIIIWPSDFVQLYSLIMGQ